MQGTKNLVGRLALGGILVLAGCSSSPDSRCSAANCQKLYDCHLGLEGAPSNPGVCSLQDFLDAELSLCVKACEADNQGEILGCVASKFGASCPEPDGGYATIGEIEAACTGGISDGGGVTCGPNCQACGANCSTQETACPSTCADAGSCIDCEYDCAQTSRSCFLGCPTN